MNEIDESLECTLCGHSHPDEVATAWGLPGFGPALRRLLVADDGDRRCRPCRRLGDGPPSRLASGGVCLMDDLTIVAQWAKSNGAPAAVYNAACRLLADRAGPALRVVVRRDPA